MIGWTLERAASALREATEEELAAVTEVNLLRLELDEAQKALRHASGKKAGAQEILVKVANGKFL